MSNPSQSTLEQIPNLQAFTGVAPGSEQGDRAYVTFGTLPAQAGRAEATAASAEQATRHLTTVEAARAYLDSLETRIPDDPRRAEASHHMGRLASFSLRLGMGVDRVMGATIGGTANVLSKVSPKLASVAPMLVMAAGTFGASKLGNMDIGHHVATNLVTSGHEHLSHIRLEAYSSNDPSSSASPHPTATPDQSASPHPSQTPSPNSSPTPSATPTHPHPTATPSTPHTGPNHNQAPSGATASTPATPEQVKVFGPDHKMHIDYAGSQPGVTPDANHDLHFVQHENGSMTVKLVGMQEGGTTINGHNITHAQMQHLHIAMNVNVNGHTETVWMTTHNGTLHAPKEFAHLLDRRDFNTLQEIVPGKNGEHWTSISTVTGNGHEYTVHELHHHVTNLQNHLEAGGAHSGAGNPTGAKMVESSTTFNTHVDLTGNHPVLLYNGNHALQIGLPANVLTPEGTHYINITDLDGATFNHGHWQLTHAAQEHINAALQQHGLYAKFETDKNGNITAMHIDALKAGDKMDLQLPPGYHATLDPAHKALIITLPDGKGKVTVPVPDWAHYKNTGTLDLAQLQPAIKSALASKHVAIVFRGHSATAAGAATASPSPSATRSASASATGSPTGTASSGATAATAAGNTQTANAESSGGGGDIPAWVGWTALAVLVTGGAVVVAERARRRGAFDDDSRFRRRVINPTIPFARHRTEARETQAQQEREQAGINAREAARTTILNPESDAADTLLTQLKNPDLGAEFTVGAAYAESRETVNAYANLVAPEVREDGTPDAETLVRHLRDLGIPMGTAQFVATPDGALTIEDTDEGASIKAIAAQLVDRYGALPQREAFLGNDETREALTNTTELLNEYEGADAGRQVEIRTQLRPFVQGILDRIANGTPEGYRARLIDAMGLEGDVTLDAATGSYMFEDENVVEIARDLAAFGPATPPTPPPAA